LYLLRVFGGGGKCLVSAISMAIILQGCKLTLTSWSTT
jgi:hypothetical protein